MPATKVSDYVVNYLASRGVTHVYELAGGMLAHLLDSFGRLGAPRLVSMHHEQGAGFAAEGHARMSGVPGVALATSGPGATNLLTAIGSCFFDSTPAVFITGQVNREELRRDRPVRQMGFQETDIVSMARPITKWAVLVERPEDVPGVLAEAFDCATRGRGGPVLIDIPMDVQRCIIDAPLPAPQVRAAVGLAPGEASRQGAVALEEVLAGAVRPLVLAGGGARAGSATPAVVAALERLGVPVVCSLLGMDLLHRDHPLRVGLIGSYGNRWANTALAECDALLVLGSRLDIRQTGTDTAGFAARPIVQVDVDPGEIGQRIAVAHRVVADAGDFARAVLERPPPGRDPSAWRAHLAALRARWPDTGEAPGLDGVNPNALMKAIGRCSAVASAIVVDVGQHQMWAGQSLAPAPGQRFITSGGMGAMGFALPAAVGAAFAAPGRPVLVVAGDGGFQLNIQELQSIRRNRLPVKMVVVNNRAHGMVRQFQESYFDSRFQSTVEGYDPPDFSRVAAAYGIDGTRVACDTGPESSWGPQLDEGLAGLWRDPEAPALLEVLISTRANAYPKLAFGRTIADMEPDATPLGMEGT